MTLNQTLIDEIREADPDTQVEALVRLCKKGLWDYLDHASTIDIHYQVIGRCHELGISTHPKKRKAKS